MNKHCALVYTHILGVFEEPCFGRLSVGYGLLGSECLKVENKNNINL